MKLGYSVDRLVLGDQVLLPRRLCIQMSENCLMSDNVLFEEAMLDELFQVPSKSPTMAGRVSFTFVVGAVFLQSKK